VDVAWQVFTAAVAFDPEDPYSRQLSLTPYPFPSAFRFGIPRPQDLQFFGNQDSENAFKDSVLGLQQMGGRAVEIDFRLFNEVAEMLYGSALVAERYACMQSFFDQCPLNVIEPVRGIFEKGKKFTAAEILIAQQKIKRLGQEAVKLWVGIDLLVVPTAPTHYKIADVLQERGKPNSLNKNLGYYTNFVNLLDYAAISVPSVLKPGGLPYGITLIGLAGSDFQLAELGHRFHHTRQLPLGATGEAMSAFVPLTLTDDEVKVRVAVVGAHLSGMPLHHQLTDRNAKLIQKCKTVSSYQLFALAGSVPPKPALLYVGNALYCQELTCYSEAPCPHSGASIDVEVYELSPPHFGTFTALIPPPLAMGTVTLDDGSTVKGFVAESWAFSGAFNITKFGSWRSYLAQGA
jgi:allophanate hydrolase